MCILRQGGAQHSGADFRKSRLPAGGVVAEGREATVIDGAQLPGRYVPGGFEDVVPISSGVSTRGSMGATTPMKMR